MVNNLTTTDWLVLTSTLGGTLGSGFSVVVDTFLLHTQGIKINYIRRIRDCFLGSLSTGLLAGCLTFSFASIDIQSVEHISPLTMFMISFAMVASATLAELVKLTISNIFIWARSNHF
jgi:hypothetical protein